MKICVAFVFCSCCLIPFVSAQTNIVLTFDVLPSSQGWTLRELNTAIPETTAFSLTNGELHQDTLGIGFQGQGTVSYYVSNAVNTNLPFCVQVTARCVAQENDGLNNYFGMAVDLLASGYGIGIGIAPDRIVDHGGNLLLFEDNTTNHTFILKGLFSASPACQLFVDGGLVASNFASFYAGPENRLQFGDLTGGANAEGYFSALSYEQVVQPTIAIYPAVEIAWDSISNVLYQVQYSTQLNTNQWFNLGAPVIGTGTNISVFDSTRINPGRFYRVSVMH